MARKAAAALPLNGEMEWLGRVREVRHPVDPTHPLRVSQRITRGGQLPRPSVPYPERHPYCEFNFAIEGRGEQFVAMEKVVRSRGDMMLLGPGIPHYATIRQCPNHVIVVHFLPILLFELSPSDGARILARFTSSRSISQRVVRPPEALQEKFAAYFTSMAEEYERAELGSDLCVRARLMDALVALLRWEASTGAVIPHDSAASSNWVKLEKCLHFIYNHYKEPLYIEQIAREVGLSAYGLHRLFHAAFGISCIQYLGAYRISQAASLLCLSGARVTEVAAEVGFETLSHFNSAFRRSQGMSPTEYIRIHSGGK